MEGAFDAPAQTASRRARVACGDPAWTRFAIYAAVLLLGSSVAGPLAVRSRIQLEPALARFAIQLGASGASLQRPPSGDDVTRQPLHRLCWRTRRCARRPLDQLQASRIASTERPQSVFARWPAVGFWTGDELKRVGVSRGVPVTICRVPNPWGVSWENDHTILIGEGPDGIWRVPDSGGTPEAVIKVAAGEKAHGPHLLPGGEWSTVHAPAKGHRVLGRGADCRAIASHRGAARADSRRPRWPARENRASGIASNGGCSRQHSTPGNCVSLAT